MKKTILSSTLIAFLTSHIYAQFEWQITGADTIRPNEKCYLFNTKINKKVAYKSQKHGINLSWSSPQKGGSNILLKVANNEGILATNEAIAIYVEGGSYLKYGEREYGITLVWSQTPVYEWIIRIDDKVILGIHSGKKYGLFNQAKGTFLVYGKRADNYGQLKWFDDW